MTRTTTGGDGSTGVPGHRVLVVGAARSGTTWVATCLGRTVGAAYVHEPDNFDWVPFAARARAGLGLMPALEPGGDAPEPYVRMWESAFRARRPSALGRLATAVYARTPARAKSALLEPGGRSSSLRLQVATRLARPQSAPAGTVHPVVKSVNVPLAVQWVAARFEPRVLVVRRHPLDVLASRLSFGTAFFENALGYVDPRAVAVRLERWKAPARPTTTDRYEHFVWLAGFTLSAFDEAAQTNPDFHVVDYEEIGSDPLPHFRRLVADLGLEWSAGCEEFLTSSNTAGAGFETKRVAARQTGVWRERLTDEQLSVARRVLSRFPIAGRYPDLTG